MGKYIPEICQEFIATCSTEQIMLNYWVFGFIIGIVFSLLIWLVINRKECYPVKENEKE